MSETKTTAPRTVKVRIAIAVDADGGWNAVGWDRAPERELIAMAGENMEKKSVLRWIIADVPLPEDTPTVLGKVDTSHAE